MRSFIESQFPVSRVSKESYKERKSNYSQTLTGLGKWWGRKPLVLCRATIIGLLMPATDDPEADRACFLAIMTMDEEGLRARFKGIKPKTKVLEQATEAELQAYTDLESLWQNAPTPADKRERKEELATAFRELELAVFSQRGASQQKLAAFNKATTSKAPSSSFSASKPAKRSPFSMRSIPRSRTR